MEILTTEAKIKLNTYKDKLYAITPNIEQINTGTSEEPEWVAKFTDAEWVDELTKRYFVNLIGRGQAVLHRNSLIIDEVNLE